GLGRPVARHQRQGPRPRPRFPRVEPGRAAQTGRGSPAIHPGLAAMATVGRRAAAHPAAAGVVNTEARSELQATEASGDAGAIAKAKELLMGRARSKGRWIPDDALWACFQTNKEALNPRQHPAPTRCRRRKPTSA